MKQENNAVYLTGEIVSDFVFSHEVFGEKFYKFYLKTNRLSENADILPILVSERIASVKESPIGATVEVDGQIRSHNEIVDGKSKTILSVFVNDLQNTEEDEGSNIVYLRGFICKEPTYRLTPSGKEVSDVLLAVNRPYGKTDYIPCIFWGRDANYMNFQDVGTEMIVEGRFQSRSYTKKFENGESEMRTAYELSVKKLEVVENECSY